MFEKQTLSELCLPMGNTRFLFIDKVDLYNVHLKLLYICMTMNQSSVSTQTTMCKFTMYRPRTTDTQRKLFFENPKLLGLGRQTGPKYLGELLDIFGQTTAPFFMVLSMWLFFLQKTLVFRPETYKSQISPKYDIGCKNFGK